MPVIELTGISKSFGPVHALNGVDLAVSEGELVTLIGPSGCGKTTLLRIVAGLETPTNGRVAIHGRTPIEACRLHQVGVAFQRPALVPSLTALENVRLTLDITRKENCYSPEELLQQFGLGDSLTKHPHQLSGGMQQRVNIAAALVHRPEVLLLDEPFGALDELTRERLGEWLRTILDQSRQTTLFVTHSIDEAVYLSTRIVVMTSEGKIVSTVKINLPEPRNKQLRTTNDFLRLEKQVRETLTDPRNGGGK